MDTKKGIPLRKCRIVTNYTHAVSAFFAVVQTPFLKNTKSVISATNLFLVLFELNKTDCFVQNFIVRLGFFRIKLFFATVDA